MKCKSSCEAGRGFLKPVEMEDSTTLPTVEILLTQVHAAHKRAIRELEEKLQVQRSSSDNCKQCKELKAALTECREKYFEVLQQQKQQIDSMEKRLANVKFIENSRNTRSVGTQVGEEDHGRGEVIVVTDRGSSSNSCTSRKRVLQSTTPPSARKKPGFIVVEETASEASSTLLKNKESPDKHIAVRSDNLLLLNATSNSLEHLQQPPLVLVPDSPEGNGKRTDRFEQIQALLSSHQKVRKWLSEVPETLQMENIPQESGKVENLSLCSFDSKEAGTFPSKENVPSNDHCLNTKEESSGEIIKNNDSHPKDLNSFRQETVSIRKYFLSTKRDECRATKSLNDSPMRVRSENVPKMNSPETSNIPNGRVFHSEKKIRGETWCTKRKKKFQSKLRLKGKTTTIPDKFADVMNRRADSLDLDATMLPPSDKTKNVVTVNTSAFKQEVEIFSSPEDKENVNGSWAESVSGSEDLLAANKNGLLIDVSKEETKNDEKTAVVPKVNSSFDEIPSKSEKIPFKVKEQTVRGRASRDQMPGHECDYCIQYYDNLGLSEDAKKERLKFCSKHRANNPLPSTPEHYWEIGFPDTPECQERGYLNVTQKVQLRPRRRRPLK